MMNKRIKELAEQAEVWNTSGDKDKCEVDLEKFVELIVREVFLVIENERFDIYEPVIQKVKQHFGVA